MTPFVTAAVLLAAFCHASWNAMIRGGGDKLVGMALLVTGSGIMALPFLPFVPGPDVAAWPWLLASIVIHVAYNGFLALSYTHGELSRAYPILRGLAPLMTLAVSLAFLGEGVETIEALGIVVLGIGIILLAFEHGWRKVLASPQGPASRSPPPSASPATPSPTGSVRGPPARPPPTSSGCSRSMRFPPSSSHWRFGAVRRPSTASGIHGRLRWSGARCRSLPTGS
jgi:multidrug transporter EmrE-like cation transporter